jgi:hypothetical protein
MKTEHPTGSSVIAAMLAGFVFLASSCGQSSSSAMPPTPSPAASPTPAASPPPGGPVPAPLLGVWILNTPNPDPGLALDGIINGKEQLTLTATTYRVEPVNNNPSPRMPDAGAVVVNNTEIDFFSETSGQPLCHLQLPDGVGRYKWTLTGTVLHFAPLTVTGYFGDPCGRLVLADQSYVRTS